MPIASNRRPAVGGAGRCFVSLLLSACALTGCGKKKSEDEPVTAPLPVGQASVDRLSTGIGAARALDAELAPSSTVWRRAIVVDDKRLVLVGDAQSVTVALVTDDAGRTWHGLRADALGWAGWGAGADGTVVVATGTREQPRVKLPAGQLAPIDSARTAFAAEGVAFASPSPLFPVDGPLARAKSPLDALLPAVLSKDLAAVIVEDAPRRSVVAYATPPGGQAPPPARLPAGERPAAPMGRPSLLVTLRGRDLLTRPYPVPGKPLEPPTKAASVQPTPTLAQELSAPPACESGSWSFSAVTQPRNGLAIIGVSPEGSATVTVADARKGAPIGCGATRLVAQVSDGKNAGTTSLATCDRAGACVVPNTPPFRPWTEPHEERMLAEITGQGVIATLMSKAGERWGVYLTQSADGGRVYELPRALAEGTGDRGRLEVGAIVSLGARALLLLEADVTGTSRRGWYVTASDDGGVTWNPP